MVAAELDAVRIYPRLKLTGVEVGYCPDGFITVLIESAGIYKSLCRYLDSPHRKTIRELRRNSGSYRNGCVKWNQRMRAGSIALVNEFQRAGGAQGAVRREGKFHFETAVLQGNGRSCWRGALFLGKLRQSLALIH